MVVIKEEEQDVPLSLLGVEEEEKVVVEEENVLLSPFGVEANEKVVVVVVITVFHHDLMTTKNKMESPPIFSVRVLSVTRDTCF